jgi:hypothetical protein
MAAAAAIASVSPLLRRPDAAEIEKPTNGQYIRPWLAGPRVTVELRSDKTQLVGQGFVAEPTPGTPVNVDVVVC